MSKDINEYESNPDDLNVDEENVEALINQMDAGVIDDTPPKDADDTESKAADSAKEAETIPPKLDTDTEQVADVVPEAEQAPAKQVVKSRDGTHEIPYSVLANERAKSSQLQKELDELKSEKAEAASSSSDEAGTGASADIDEADLAQFEEEFGEEAAEAERKRRKHYAELEARTKKVEAKLAKQEAIEKEAADQAAQDEADAQAAMAVSVNEAIDSIPTLKQWRDSNDPMWGIAVNLDETLKSSPEFKDMSLSDRFNVVVARLTGQSPESSTNQTNQGKKLDDVLATEEANARRAPNSLSDLPGGASPDQSEHDTLERLTPKQLEAKFEKMSEIEQEEYLSRL